MYLSGLSNHCQNCIVKPSTERQRIASEQAAAARSVAAARARIAAVRARREQLDHAREQLETERKRKLQQARDNRKPDLDKPMRGVRLSHILACHGAHAHVHRSNTRP